MYKSIESIKTPVFLMRFTKLLAWLFLILPILMLLLPWVQNITATGAVTAFSPSERRQTVDAPIKGVIKKWYVKEGAKVKAGALLLEMTDVDPQFKERLNAQRDISLAKLEAKEAELKSYQIQLVSLMSARDAKISAAQFKNDVAKQKILAAAESIAAAKATVEAAEFQISRLQRLLDDGLVSKRDTEVAQRDFIVAKRSLNSAQAQYDSAKAEEKSTLSEVQQARADAQASLNVSQAVADKVRGEIADSRNSLANAEINLSRQSAQNVVAPRDGSVFRLPINSQSEIISQGEPLLVIVPDTKSRAVELMVSGLDAALILPDSKVRLEFEGWPAIQFSGWPNVTFGTFGGKVAFVDAADDGKGSFRIMVVPDESQPNWPSERFLRQGASTRGWVLLNKVSIGYEMWRIFNGFPPRITNPSSDGSKGNIKSSAIDE